MQQITTMLSVNSVGLAAALLAVDIPLLAPPLPYVGDGLPKDGNVRWSFAERSTDGSRTLERCIKLWHDAHWLAHPLAPTIKDAPSYLPLAYARHAWKNRLALLDFLAHRVPLYLSPLKLGGSHPLIIRAALKPSPDAALVPMQDVRPQGVQIKETTATDFVAAALAIGIPLRGVRMDGNSVIWQLSAVVTSCGLSVPELAARWQDWPWLQDPHNDSPLAVLAVASHNRQRLLCAIKEAPYKMIVARRGDRYAIFRSDSNQDTLNQIASTLAK